MPANAKDSYDLVILGGGSGGYACAFRAAQLGMSVAVIEKDRLGGTCLHVGCIPTKALLHAAEVADACRGADRFGVNASFSGIDMTGVHAYKDKVVDRLYRGLQGLATAHGIDLIEGTGSLVDGTTIEVDGRRITGRNLVLATGSTPRSIPGITAGGRIVTSEEALKLEELPPRVLVLGGGVIGVEFASVFASFGSAVTVIEGLPRLVAGEDEAISTALGRAFAKRRITTKTGAKVIAAVDGSDAVRVSLEDGSELEGDLLLVAVGRVPCTEGLGFAEAGVRLVDGYVNTDDRLRTSLPTVYAVGDIVPGLQLAHRGFQQGIFVAEHIAGKNPQRIPESSIPRVTYCEPEIASVGLTERQAREQYPDIETLDYNLGGNGKSQILQTQGFVKTVRVTNGPVVGIHLIGSRVGEQIGEAQLIIGWEAQPEDVAPLIHAHPTQNEALGEAHLALAGTPLHAHH